MSISLINGLDFGNNTFKSFQQNTVLKNCCLIYYGLLNSQNLHIVQLCHCIVLWLVGNVSLHSFCNFLVNILELCLLLYYIYSENSICSACAQNEKAGF